jgi:hypothetical protein
MDAQLHQKGASNRYSCREFFTVFAQPSCPLQKREGVTIVLRDNGPELCAALRCIGELIGFDSVAVATREPRRARYRRSACPSD